MSTGLTPPPAPRPPIQKETTVGNYFVSNYPPFSFWKPERLGELLAALERPPKPGTPLGIYLHIPFCRKRCHFCYFRVYTDKDSAAIRGYINAAIEELSIYAAKPFIGGRKPNFIYFGGGTPSYLSVDQLKHLTESMKALLPWDEAEEVTFEAEPGTLTDLKLKAIRELGVTRLSLGVENFDDHILEINWRENVRKTLAMSPDSVTIYEMEIPFNTTIYQQMKAEGRLVAPVADWETKRRWVDYAWNELGHAGYHVASAYTAVKDPGKTQFIYRDRLWAGADLLALGVASFGHIGGTHYQNHHDFDPYVARLNQGELPLYRALTPSDDERLIREFVLQLKLGRVSRAYFQKKFAVDPGERFATPIQRLKDWGFLTVEGDQIMLNREGLLQVDRLLHEFFLPEHRHARYA